MKNNQIKIVKSDVVICGGGIAGCSAAIQSARNGVKTILLEKTVFPGGLATSGLVYIYLPICDGYGNQIIHGLGEELLHASIKYGPGDIPEDWRSPEPKVMNQRFFTKFSPSSFILSLDELLEEAGVDVWYDTLVCSAQTDDNLQIKSVEVENKSGRIRIEAKCFIDATGDADLAVKSGAETFDSTNLLSIWAIEYDKHAPEDWHKLAPELGRIVINQKDSKAEEYRGISGSSVSRFIKETRTMVRQRYQTALKDGANRNDLFPLLLPSMADFRTTRFIKGKTVLNSSTQELSFDDSIGIIADWRKPSPTIELPYSILLPEKVRGLLAAGRCISIKGESVELVRVIPVAAMTGQVAGLAAALSVKKDCMPDELPVEELQKELKAQGFILHR